MKRVLFLAALMVTLLTSCYKDNATYTFEVTGADQKYTISYQNDHGEWIQDQIVDNGWSYYSEHDSDWRLKLNVQGNDIKVNLYKRTKLIKSWEGTGTLEINEKINH